MSFTEAQIEAAATVAAEKANGGRFTDPLFYKPEHQQFWREVVKTALETAASPWQPIETAPRDGSEVLLGFSGSADMDFYRWNQELADHPDFSGYPAEQCGWADRSSDPPHTMPTHWMRIEPPA